MTGRIACSLLAVSAAVSCRAQPSSSPYANGPVVLVSPDSGPSELQRRLATIPPAPSNPNDVSIRIGKALDAFHGATQGRRGYIAIDKPLYQPGESIWFRSFDLASADLSGGGRAITTFKLISPRGSTVLEKAVLTENGGAANDFVLPAGVSGGEYILRAQTVGSLDRGTITERKVIVSTYQPPRIKKKLEFLRKAYGPGDTVMATIELHRATGEALATKTVTGLVTLDGTDLTRTPVTTDAQGNAVVQFTLPASIQRGDGLLTILVDDGGVTESVQKRIPITLARVGLPGGLTFQTWQLQELRDKKLIDFYETRAREVILYFRAMPPGAVVDVPLELMATVPGTFTSPASRAYLYYTNEHKHWVEPTTITVAP